MAWVDSLEVPVQGALTAAGDWLGDVLAPVLEVDVHAVEADDIEVRDSRTGVADDRLDGEGLADLSGQLVVVHGDHRIVEQQRCDQAQEIHRVPAVSRTSRGAAMSKAPTAATAMTSGEVR